MKRKSGPQELSIANTELAFQNDEKEKRAQELSVANEELAFQNDEKEKRAQELSVANKELAFQNDEKEKRAQELSVANKELAFQNDEKEKRAAELGIANNELAFQNDEKEKRAAELVIANKELAFQNDEKVKRAAELRIANYARGLIEASRDPLVTISPEGKITDMNQATVNITGIEREQLLGSDFFDYFTEPQMAREVYQEVFAKGSVADSPLTLRHKDGKLTDVLFNGSVYKNDQGIVLGVVIVARDVTDQKRIATELIEAKECRRAGHRAGRGSPGQSRKRHPDRRRCREGQAAVSQQHEPRDSHADECHHRLHEGGAENGADRKAARIPDGHQNQRRHADRAHQRHSGPGQSGCRQDDVRADSVQDARLRCRRWCTCSKPRFRRKTWSW